MLMHHLRVLPLLVRMHVRSKMEYRGAFWLDRLAQILSYGSVFATIGILLARFDTLGGWTGRSLRCCSASNCWLIRSAPR